MRAVISFLLPAVVAVCGLLIALQKEKDRKNRMLAGIICIASVGIVLANMASAQKAATAIKDLRAELATVRSASLGSTELPFVRLLLHDRPVSERDKLLQEDFTENDYHTAKLFVLNPSELPMYNTSLRIFSMTDWEQRIRKGRFPMSQVSMTAHFEAAHSYYDMEILHPGEEKALGEFSVEEPLKQYDVQVDFRTRTGSGSKMICSTYVNGRWIQASRTYRWDRDTPIITKDEVPPDFPQRKAGDFSPSASIAPWR